jgi:hypothetical protein
VLQWFTATLSGTKFGNVAFRCMGGLSGGLSAVVSADVSVDESVLLSAGPDYGHFNGLSARRVRRTVQRTRGVAIKSREMIT